MLHWTTTREAMVMPPSFVSRKSLTKETTVAVYLISYDLMSPGHNYGTLIEALKKQGARKVILSAWALSTISTAAQIRDWVQSYVDSNDRIVVTELNNWATWNSMFDLNQIWDYFLPDSLSPCVPS
jgi:hypothetical protein